MNLHQMFSEKFRLFMEKSGFTEYQNAFYRLYNGEMFQCIAVKTDASGAYSVCCGSVPYWCYDIERGDIDTEHGFDDDWLYKAVYEYNGRKIKTVFDEESPEKNEQDMQLWLQITKEIILPDMCNISTFSQYVDETLEFLKETHIVRGVSGIIGRIMLAYRTYITGSFDYMKEYIALYEQCLREHLEQADKLYDPDDIVDWPGVMRYRLEHGFEFEKQKIAENDLEWIVPVYERLSSSMYRRMRDIIGITDLPDEQ